MRMAWGNAEKKSRMFLSYQFIYKKVALNNMLFSETIVY